MKVLLILSLFLLQGCSHLFYQPSERHFYDPAQFKLSYEDVWFDSLDGTKLHGWFFPANTSKPKGTIVQFHGNAQNISTHFLSLVWLVNEGYNLFTFDYRGYGKSKGNSTQAGLYQDALAALNMGKEFHSTRGQGHFIVFGQSLGGIVSLRALPDFKEKDEVSLLVLDSTFDSYQGIASDKLRSRWFLWPFSPLAYLLISDKYASKNVLEKITLPTLVIVGEGDEVIPAKFGKQIFQEIPALKKWLWDIPDGGHIGVFHHNAVSYRKDFLQLLDKMSLD